MVSKRLLTCLAFTAAAGFLLATASASDAQPPAKRILLIGKEPDHPPRSHEYMATCRLLAACLNRVEGVEATVSDGWPDEPLDAFAAVVLYRAPFAEEMFVGPRSGEARRLLDSGGGLVTIHWSVGVPPEGYDALGGVMTRYQGGVWLSNSGQVAIGQSRVRTLQPDHPILRGVRLESIRDEWYFNPEVAADAAPLWSVDTESGPLTVAWTYQRPGGGRTFATTLGHFWENFTREPFRKAIVNGVLWAAQADVPAGGADVEVNRELLELEAAERQPALSP
ncbi:ThuA domain-containing protein [Botrimarina sp.]|uniref:ThuA domain-containing protein n=1 Tax=Botrimarina sp. TaxID=2795802 RepID=UPI0032ED0D35